ncbi:MAG TPA: D-ribose pyranase [Bryobacteraceae bacterium]|nr:D-ribose pyranase [Bryobacteraceae bacterium]
MLRTGILNPAINSLISRVRHTNTLVIADRGFPYWPQVETVDVSLVDGIPKVLDVLRAIRANFVLGRIFMAEEFRAVNDQPTLLEFEQAALGVPVVFEPHLDLKKRVPQAVGLIRTGDTVPYANMILESA